MFTTRQSGEAFNEPRVPFILSSDQEFESELHNRFIHANHREVKACNTLVP